MSELRVMQLLHYLSVCLPQRPIRTTGWLSSAAYFAKTSPWGAVTDSPPAPPYQNLKLLPQHNTTIATDKQATMSYDRREGGMSVCVMCICEFQFMIYVSACLLQGLFAFSMRGWFSMYIYMCCVCVCVCVCVWLVG